MTITSKQMMLFLFASGLLCAAASFAHPVTPTLFTNLGLGSYLFGFVMAAAQLGNFLFSPFWGKISQYLSIHRTVLISCVCYSVGQVLFGLSTTELQFIMARFFTGIFMGGSFVCCLIYLVSVCPDEATRGKYLTVYATMQTVTGTLGYFIGGVLGEVFTHLAIIVQVVLLLFSGVLLYVSCKPGSEDGELTTAGVKTVLREANPFTAFAGVKMFMTGVLALLLLACTLQQLGNMAFEQTFNYYLRDAFGLSSGYNGLIKGVMGLLTLIANTTLGMFLIRKTNVNKTVLYVLMVCATTTITAVLAGNFQLFLLINTVYFVANSISVPMMQDMVASRAVGEHRNMIISFYNAMKAFGGIFGALSAGVLYTTWAKLPFLFGAGAFLLALLLSWMYERRTRTGSREAPGS